MALARLTVPWDSEINKLACPCCGAPVDLESADLLAPGDMKDEIDKWIDGAVGPQGEEPTVDEF